MLTLLNEVEQNNGQDDHDDIVARMIVPESPSSWDAKGLLNSSLCLEPVAYINIYLFSSRQKQVANLQATAQVICDVFHHKI